MDRQAWQKELKVYDPINQYVISIKEHRPYIECDCFLQYICVLFRVVS